MTDKKLDETILCLTQLMQDQKHIISLLESMRPIQTQIEHTTHTHPPIRIYSDELTPPCREFSKPPGINPILKPKGGK